MTGEGGLRITAVAYKKACSHAQAVLALALFVALIGWYENLLELTAWWLPSVLGAALVLVICLAEKNAKRRTLALKSMAVMMVLALCVVPQAREGVKILCNRLFSASEAQNRYVYTRLSVLAQGRDAVECERLVRLLGAILGAIVSVWAVKYTRWIVRGIALLALGIEIYFGIVPDPLWQIVLFLSIAGVMAYDGWGILPQLNCLCLGVVALAIGLTVGMLFSGVDSVLEAHSEQLRDWLSQTVNPGAAEVMGESTVNLIRKEGVLSEEEVSERSDEVQQNREYERKLSYRKDISNPRPIDYVKMAVLLLMVILLLIGPFLPFLWMDKQKKKAAARRAAFDAPECSLAIDAMFQHIVRCLEAFGIADDNRPFSQLMEGDTSGLPAAYVEAYRQTVGLWQEAVYSEHCMTQEQKESVSHLLEQTERFVYQQSGRKGRFRLRYVDCLIIPEDMV